MYGLIFSKLFDDDIDSTYQYIKENLEAPMAAENLLKEVKQKLEYLKENPTIRPVIKKDELIEALNLRAIKVKNYVIYYSVNEEKQKIRLVRFLYNKRDWINILRGN
jgi:plasmid stabilization system protein ParE